MRRRDLIATGTAIALGMAASSALASESEAPAEVSTVNITGVSLPIIVEGRLRNYVFVAVRLTPGPGAAVEEIRAKEPYFRDALVRAAHRVSFAVPGDWNRLNENAVNAAVMAIAGVVCSHGAVVKSEVAMQTPRRRTGPLPA